jgi:cytochrome oxidase Cu insertion factor (SCO1/SenC/PrrC family)
MRNSFVLFLLCCLFTCCIKEETDNRDTGFIVAAGNPAPDFLIHYRDGTKQSLKSFRGKVVLIQFAASWCNVCQEIMPVLERDFNLKLLDRNGKIVFLTRLYNEQEFVRLGQKIDSLLQK